LRGFDIVVFAKALSLMNGVGLASSHENIRISDEYFAPCKGEFRRTSAEGRWGACHAPPARHLPESLPT
jgi:hypothetical protein